MGSEPQNQGGQGKQISKRKMSALRVFYFFKREGGLDTRPLPKSRTGQNVPVGLTTIHDVRPQKCTWSSLERTFLNQQNKLFADERWMNLFPRVFFFSQSGNACRQICLDPFTQSPCSSLFLKCKHN